jgi:thiol-disulfide isomerase/thioredoxin
MMQVLLYLLGGIALLVLTAQLVLQRQARKALDHQVKSLGGPMGEAVHTGTRVIAYFYAPTCLASRKQTPVIDKLDAEYENVFRIDVTEEFEMARAIGVHTTPTIVIFEGGEIRDILTGTTTEETLRESLL